MRQPIAIDTLGKLWGRDAIYLETFDWKYQTIQISGEINGDLCEIRKRDTFIPYLITFHGVIDFRVIGIDFYNNNEYTSSFEEIRNNNEQYDNQYQSYVLHTYDHVFEIIAKCYDCQLNP